MHQDTCVLTLPFSKKKKHEKAFSLGKIGKVMSLMVDIWDKLSLRCAGGEK